MIGKLLGAILPKVFDVVDQAVTDKDKAAELKSAIQLKLLESSDREVEAAAKVIIAEAQGHSWLQRNWRPLLMMVIIVIIANNYILFPYASLFTDRVTVLELPQALYNLMAIGVGGYVVGRSGEKIVTQWKNGK